MILAAMLVLTGKARATEYDRGVYLPSAVPEAAGAGALALEVDVLTDLPYPGATPLVYLRGGGAVTDRLRFGGAFGLEPGYKLAGEPQNYWATLSSRYEVVESPRIIVAGFAATGYWLDLDGCWLCWSGPPQTVDDVFLLVGAAVEGPLAWDGRLRFDASIPIVVSD